MEWAKNELGLKTETFAPIKVLISYIHVYGIAIELFLKLHVLRSVILDVTLL